MVGAVHKTWKYLDDRLEYVAVGGACSRCERDEQCIQNLS
jgi:hypothetical protein